ncbi:hypothetical protein CDO46_03660 [Pigmentiphaga sp. NML030171]|uniref:hypothetical protein n=1 Tax=unclassified Pigmentiphaga TaxID=2626614 RepID=UPI000B41277B|nr:hypothetical protein [Pigmentiphaga sp. NML030171]OVZ65978.1 hypothetical protein CDO46_03660 [Pigmentiphaga sp. NML030171]
MRKPIVIASVLVVLAALAAGAIAGSRVTLLVLDVPDRQATLLVKRSATLGMGWLESETTLCRRQQPGSPLHSVMLSPDFCPLALAAGQETRGERVLLTLPFMAWLHGLAGRTLA